MEETLPAPRIRRLVTPGDSRTAGTAAVWLPWLAAPLFMAAPIGGCAVADRWRPPVAQATGQPAAEVDPGVPIVQPGAIVTIDRR